MYPALSDRDARDLSNCFEAVGDIGLLRSNHSWYFELSQCDNAVGATFSFISNELNTSYNRADLRLIYGYTNMRAMIKYGLDYLIENWSDAPRFATLVRAIRYGANKAYRQTHPTIAEIFNAIPSDVTSSSSFGVYLRRTYTDLTNDDIRNLATCFDHTDDEVLRRTTHCWYFELSCCSAATDRTINYINEKLDTTYDRSNLDLVDGYTDLKEMIEEGLFRICRHRGTTYLNMELEDAIVTALTNDLEEPQPTDADGPALTASSAHQAREIQSLTNESAGESRATRLLYSDLNEMFNSVVNHKVASAGMIITKEELDFCRLNGVSCVVGYDGPKAIKVFISDRIVDRSFLLTGSEVDICCICMDSPPHHKCSTCVSGLYCSKCYHNLSKIVTGHSCATCRQTLVIEELDVHELERKPGEALSAWRIRKNKKLIADLMAENERLASEAGQEVD
jgi:hypothetical protein